MGTTVLLVKSFLPVSKNPKQYIKHTIGRIINMNALINDMIRAITNTISDASILSQS